MQEDAFQQHMLERNLADNTRQQRTYALKRIERAHELDLDQEFDRDGLQSLVSRFRYSTADARAGKPDPTRLGLEPEKVLTQLRWYLSHIQDYRRFRGAAGDFDGGALEPAETLETETIAEAVSQTFGLERDLQMALRASLGQLEEGLTIADGGSEAKVEAGFIDILARDKDGAWTVIELKAGSSKPAAIAQILAYMGCIAEEKQAAARGILIASEHDQRVILAAKAVSNLMLRTYKYRFEFE